ncbi:hypothetical protein KI387_020117, partial [Taxus chinensis]
SSWHREWLLDLLAIWAFACANVFSQADQLLKGMKSRVDEMRENRSKSMQRVLLLAEALYQYGKSDYIRAYDILGPNFNVHEYKVIGASDEQLDVFDEVCNRSFGAKGSDQEWSPLYMAFVGEGLFNEEGRGLRNCSRKSQSSRNDILHIEMN